MINLQSNTATIMSDESIKKPVVVIWRHNAAVAGSRDGGRYADVPLLVLKMPSLYICIYIFEVLL